jgi:hypothetical protein
MSKFLTGNIELEEICLDSSPKPDGSQKSISLQLSGWKNQPDIQTANDNLSIVRITTVKHDVIRKQTTFNLEAIPKSKGQDTLLDMANTTYEELGITVGIVTNHGNFRYDLLADLLGRSEDPVKLWAYQRILAKENNVVSDRDKWSEVLKDQPLKQKTEGTLDCGTACDRFGNRFYGRKHYHVGAQSPYYRPFWKTGMGVGKKDQIDIDADAQKRGVTEITRLLGKGEAVVVFVVHHDGFNVDRSGKILVSGETHWLTIVGCDALSSNFLYTDPWPYGSFLSYNSGIFGDVNSQFMGILTFNKDSNQVVTPNGSAGGFKYLLLSGPKG